MASLHSNIAAVTLLWFKKLLLKKVNFLFFLISKHFFWLVLYHMRAIVSNALDWATQQHTRGCSVEQLRWRGYCSSRSDREGPFWPVGQLPWTQASTLGKMLLYYMTPQTVTATSTLVSVLQPS